MNPFLYDAEDDEWFEIIGMYEEEFIGYELTDVGERCWELLSFYFNEEKKYILEGKHVFIIDQVAI